MEKLSVTAVAQEQTRKAAESSSGRSSHTLYGGQRNDLRQTVIAMTAGTTLAEHQNPGEATVFVLDGEVRLDAEGDSATGTAGQLLVVPQAPHSLEALSDSVVMLTVAKHYR